GGQYTHGAIWAAMAFAALDERERAWQLLDMINPVRHGDSRDAVARYKVEPYVMAADVYSVAPHTGRGGWSWYTGSAGWMYRLVVESLLGLRRVAADGGVRLVLAPRLPAAWTHCTLQVRQRATLYEIEVVQRDGDGGGELRLDGTLQHDNSLPLVDDGRLHRVQLTLFTRAQRGTAGETSLVGSDGPAK
nr:hypothetical protein [Caldimonas sp.]